MSERIKHKNHVALIGNAGRDGEIRPAGGGQLGFVTLATNRNWKDKEGEWHTATTWHSLVGWADMAGIIGDIKKGDTVEVLEGNIENREWETEGGEKRSSTQIRVWELKVLQRAADREKPKPADEAKPDDDLPF